MTFIPGSPNARISEAESDSDPPQNRVNPQVESTGRVVDREEAE